MAAGKSKILNEKELGSIIDPQIWAEQFCLMHENFNPKDPRDVGLLGAWFFRAMISKAESLQKFKLLSGSNG